MRTVSLALLLMAALLWPSPSGAETTMDFYLGQASTSAASVTVTSFPLLGPKETATRRISFDDSAEFGFRGVFWSDINPGQGFSFGVSAFEASGAGAEIDVIAFSFAFMVRGLIYESEMFPRGRLQPYIGLGVLGVNAIGEFDFQPELSRRVSVEGYDFSLDLRVGLRFHTSPFGALLLEVRQTNVSPDMEDSDSDFTISGDEAKAKLSTSHMYLGYSFLY